ncbi:DUF2092 domain-containing protein [Shimia abyssi]|uniref:DUF2092 domain-containing protein n=1 Tax=Shimia abyssi TaxID=1662395 RepID=A0A2P8F7K9_9RHOB|nr:DUF2092 domain-containing protein [Shimia abyssi]PSL17699.1 hypothetical protein CLV88_11546 [Shimia abyssi]
MNCRRAFVIFGVIAFSQGAGAQDTGDQLIDPKALGLVEKATEYVAEQGSISVSWFVSFDEVIDGREVVTHIRSGDTILARDVGYYSYAEQGTDVREYFFDGTVLSVHLLERNAYVQLPYWGSFDALAARIAQEFDTALPIWQVLVRDSADQLLGEVTSAAYLGTKRIAGRDTHHIAMSTYEYDLQIWLSDEADTPVPVMMVGTEPYKQGWPQFRVYFQNWNFEPVLNEELFSYEPDAKATRLAWPKADRTVRFDAGGE